MLFGFLSPVRRCRLLVVTVIATAAPALGPALAQDPPAATPAAQPKPATPARPAPPPDKTQAAKTEGQSDLKYTEGRRHFVQAVALYEDGDYAGALAEFKAAYDTAPAPAILFNIGLTYKALYRYPDAIEVLEQYLAEFERDRTAPRDRRRQVQRFIAEMKSLLAPVVLTVAPPTARVTIDGRPTALGGGGVATVSLAAGNHTIDVSAPEHEPERRELTVAAGTPLSLEVRLRAIPTTGKVRITSSQPNTRVLVDGQDRGLAPLELELRAGGHHLEARLDGHENFRTELMLAAGQARNLDIEMRREAPPPRPVYKKWWFWGGLGTAVAGGTAAAFLLRPGTKAPLGGTLPPNSIDVAR